MATFVELKGKIGRKGGGNTRTSLTIVNTERNGRRIKLSKGLLEELGNPSSVQISVSDTALKIGENLKNCTNNFQLTGGGDTIYKSPLIEQITEHFGLDFSERSSLTFDDVEVKLRRCNDEEIPYAIVKISTEKEEYENE